MTAAHCVNETSPVMVRLGDSDLRTEFDCLNVEEGCDIEGYVIGQPRPELRFIF